MLHVGGSEPASGSLAGPCDRVTQLVTAASVLHVVFDAQVRPRSHRGRYVAHGGLDRISLQVGADGASRVGS